MNQRNDLLEQIKNIFKNSNISLKEFMLIGIRDENNQDLDIFNDYLGCIINGNIYIARGTTDPGIYWQQHPMNTRGTAHLTLGYHENAFKIGIHGVGSVTHEAFIQATPFLVKRYTNYNNFVKNIFIEDTGMFGINFHAVVGSFQDHIGRWSAGCQVCQLLDDLKKYIEFFKGTNQYKLNLYDRKVDYYLFNKKELNI